MHKGNMLIVHGGAPTAVMNASLFGAIKAAQKSGSVAKIYGARNGLGALLQDDFINLSKLPDETLNKLPHTPASFIGTSRYPVSGEGYDKIVDKLVEHDIEFLLFNGGNGSMDACGKIVAALQRNSKAKGIRVIGIPKTMDNDIAVTDHSPGFGSAARYLAASVQELSRDLAALPIHVCIVESMGRNSGWLTAAAALADRGPHLIYVPELLFDEDSFLEKAKSLYEQFGGVLVVASEGLKGLDGATLVPPIFQVGRSVYYGDVSAHLCNLVIKKLGIKARSEKPGILGRCSIAHQSVVDRDEAILAGTEAAKAALGGQTGAMVGFKRISDKPYLAETFLIPVEEVMLHEKVLPKRYLCSEGKGITQEYIDWCRPLIGGELADFA
ncbi:6-phosphofructokinase [Treponema sp.]